MGQYSLTGAEASDLTNAISEVKIDSETLDGPSAVGETEYINSDFQDQFGYFKNIPELNAVINVKSKWAVGRGY